jgi:hypothetical protein
MLSMVALSVAPVFVFLWPAFTPVPVVFIVRFFLVFVKSFLRLAAAIATVVLTTFLVRLLAAFLRAAFFATPFAATACPGNYFYFSYWPVRIITLDDDFTWPRFPLGSRIANDQVQARSRVQRCRKDISHQLPVVALPFESDAGYMQIAISRVTERNRPEGLASTLHSTKVS